MFALLHLVFSIALWSFLKPISICDFELDKEEWVKGGFDFLLTIPTQYYLKLHITLYIWTMNMCNTEPYLDIPLIFQHLKSHRDTNIHIDKKDSGEGKILTDRCLKKQRYNFKHLTFAFGSNKWSRQRDTIQHLIILFLKPKSGTLSWICKVNITVWRLG